MKLRVRQYLDGVGVPGSLMRYRIAVGAPDLIAA